MHIMTDSIMQLHNCNVKVDEEWAAEEEHGSNIESDNKEE